MQPQHESFLKREVAVCDDLSNTISSVRVVMILMIHLETEGSIGDRRNSVGLGYLSQH